MTLLEFINRIVQVLCIRITRCKERHITSFNMTEASITSNGVGVGGRYDGYKIVTWYTIQYWIKPFTGWDDDFKYLNKAAKHIRISKKFEQQF